MIIFADNLSCCIFFHISNGDSVTGVWHRDRAKLDAFSTFSVIRKIMHKIEFLGHPMGTSGAIYALYLKFLTQRNLVAEFHRENVSFTRKTAN